MTHFEIYDDQMTQDEYEIQMTISSLAPGRLMLTLFLAAQSRRAARTAIIIRASHPATEPVYGAGQSQTFLRSCCDHHQYAFWSSGRGSYVPSRLIRTMRPDSNWRVCTILSLLWLNSTIEISLEAAPNRLATC